MKEIIQIGENVLREKAQEVPISDISSKEIQNILNDMKEALAKEEDGVAIAAPQISVSKRIFVVSKRVFESNPEAEDQIYINPKIVGLSKEKDSVDEGCLSIRWKYGKVERAIKVKVEAYNENGEKFQRGASGLLAQIFQHETDHLDGVLFVDKATDLKEYSPEDLLDNK